MNWILLGQQQHSKLSHPFGCFLVFVSSFHILFLVNLDSWTLIMPSNIIADHSDYNCLWFLYLPIMSTYVLTFCCNCFVAVRSKLHFFTETTLIFTSKILHILFVIYWKLSVETAVNLKNWSKCASLISSNVK